jgi:ADP-heptose:LPS heptosyltransferase
MTTMPDRVMVFRQGSIGDFIVSLPCFHWIRQYYGDAEIVLLTNEPSSASIVPAKSVLEGTGLVDRYISYPGGTRDPAELRRLKGEIKALSVRTLIYLAAPRSLTSTYRDYLFFRWCGLRRVLGLPGTPSRTQSLRPNGGNELWEQEAHRLGRQLAALGRVDVESENGWDLHLSSSERNEAIRVLDGMLSPREPRFNGRLLGLSVGTKQPVNDWGDDNWRAVLDGLKSLDFGLVLVGGPEDRTRSERLADTWPNPVLNLCGKISPRVSAAVLRSVRLFLCHDSGPMHLAAAAGTRCVAVFSRRNPPGKWFPAGAGHAILYPTSRSGPINAIRPRQVIAAAVEALSTLEAAA